MEKETRYLISIGINDYELKPLDYCVKDSQDISFLMSLHCNVDSANIFNIHSEYNKPVSNIYAEFEKSFNRIKSVFIENVDSIFFYFSGHGAKDGNSTSLVLHDRTVELQNFFNLFLTLKPKFVFCLIDSCFSGIGIDDEVGKLSNEFLFTQHLQLASGYNIICACASDSVAKESSKIKNGRLTRIFIDIVNDKLNYKGGILSLSQVFQFIDEEFKNNPEFEQFPFAQTKGLSTYPIAFIDQTDLKAFFSTHYISDVEYYSWDRFKIEVSEYCSLDKNLIIEFTRLIREIIRNCYIWGKASFVKIEIGSNCVSIIDNSGSFFDIFNPPEETVINGGGKTARYFKNYFSKKFSYQFKINNGETIQIFNFFVSETPNNNCVWKIEDLSDLWYIRHKNFFEIPDSCEDYKIFISHGSIDLSTTYLFLVNAIEVSQKYNKPVIIYIDESDYLKNEFMDILDNIKNYGEHKVIIK